MSSFFRPVKRAIRGLLGTDAVLRHLQVADEKRQRDVLLLGNAIQQARAFASAVDARTIALSVAESNAGARALFERHGFALETDDEARYPNGQRCLRMVTKL